jgi:hypothetical protein
MFNAFLLQNLKSFKPMLMKRVKRTLFNLFAFSLLAFAIYLNFFYKEEHTVLLNFKPATQSPSKSSGDLTAKPQPSVKK